MASKKLSAVVTIGGAVASSLKSAFGTVKAETGKVGGAISSLETRQKQLNNLIKEQSKLGRAGSALKVQYAQQELALLDKQIGKLKQVRAQLTSIENAQQANLARRSELRGQMFDTVALGLMAAAPIKAAIDFESAMADVRKVVDFEEPDGLQKMGRTIREMSQRLPMAAADIAAIVAAGGQSGLHESELELFAESAVKMGVAFGITAEQAGQMMAEMRAAFNMSQEEVNTLADKMNLLANTTAASESKIASVVQRVGPLGQVAGMAAGEVAALGATLVGIGVDESVAATGIQNFMLALVQGEAATKKQQQALKALGLDANEVAAGMQRDAQGTIMAVLEAVKQLPDERQASVLTQLFGKESIKAIAPLLNVTEQLAENLAKVNDETLYSGAVAQEYAARADTTANNLQLLRNRIASLGITIGSVVLPAMNKLLGVVGPVITSITDLAERHPRLTQAIVGTAVALVGLRVASLALGYGLTFLTGGVLKAAGLFAKLRSGAVMASMALPKVATAVRAIGLAFSATPIGMFVSALALGGLMVYRHWDGVKAFMVGTFEGIRAGLQPVVDTFRGLWEALEPIHPVFEKIGGVLRSAWEWFTGLLAPVEYTSEGLEKAGNAGRTFGELLAAGINFALTPLQLLIQGLTWVINNIGSVVEKVTAFKNVAGSVWSRTKSFFGAGDDEAETPAPAAATAELPQPLMATERGAAGPTINDQSQVTINVTQQPGQDARELAREIAREQERQRAVRQRGAMYDGAMAQ